MAINKNFVVKNGLEVKTNLILADANTNRVGIASTSPRTQLDVRGGIAATDINISGIGTIVTLKSTSGIVTNLTATNLTSTNLFVGIGTLSSVRATNINATGITTASTLNSTLIVVGSAVTISSTGINITGLSTLGNVLITPGASGIGATIGSKIGILTYYGDGSGLTNTPPGSPAGSNLQIQYNNNGNFGGSSNFIFDGNNIRISGVTTSVGGFVGNLTGSATTATNVIGGIGSITQFRASGVSTFTNGPVLIGTATSTGTVSQALQVNSGGYFNGSVGIGTTNPSSTLQLSPNATISNLGTINNFGTTLGAAATVAQFIHNNGNVSYLRIEATRNTAGSDWTTASTKIVQVIDITEMGYVEFNPNGSNYGMAFGQGATEWARFLTDGKLGIGTTNPTSRFHVIGDVNVSGVITCTDINSASDINLKDNIQTFTNGLDIVNNLRGVRFEWKENNKPSIGVIAQELETVLPELVNGSNPKTVNYNGLIGVLIEAIKELKTEVEKLKNAK